MGVDKEGKNANLVWECVSGNVWKIFMFLQHPLLSSVFFAAFSAFLLPRFLALFIQVFSQLLAARADLQVAAGRFGSGSRE